MKKSFLFLLVAAVAMFSAQAQTKADLSETALENLDKAHMLTNSGENEAAMEILNKLDKENPNNYSILWEITYTYWHSGEYDKGLEICKRLENHPAASYHAYQLEGNCLQGMGKEEEAIKAYNAKTIGYAESPGDVNLQDAIIDYFAQYDIKLTRQNVLVTNGGSEALSMAFNVILNEGDDVLIPEPYYTNYHTFVTASGGSVVPVQTTPENGYEWATEAQLEAAVTPNTKAIVCITPGNPTGRVMTLDEMKIVGEFAKKHDLWIIADEVYREFVFDGKKPTSLGMLDDIADRVLIVDSISKRYSTCGGRVGILVHRNDDFHEAVMKIAMKIPGVVCQKPGGAFYMTIKLPVESAEDFLIFMLEEFEDNGESMMFTPAAGFYATPGKGIDEIRIAYVLCQDDIRRAMELLRLGIEAYKNR